ncbi:MAG: hypothetical protein ACAH59_11165 [Pseudobdellovibrionaceae bacterium]
MVELSPLDRVLNPAWMKSSRKNKNLRFPAASIQDINSTLLLISEEAFLIRILMLMTVLMSSPLLAAPGSDSEILCQLLPTDSVLQPMASASGASPSLENKNEKQFWSLIGSVQKVFQPILKSHHMQIEIEADWDSQEQNAFASHSDDRRWLNLYGGLFRTAQMTLDNYLLVLCHEMGHHLAGAPQHPFADLSAEGQADYYATNVCLPLMLKGANNKTSLLKLAVPIQMKLKCDHVWGAGSEDSAICQRSLMASLSLTNVLSALLGDAEVSFFTPAKEVPSTTLQSYPSFQCRLDTLVAGALCRRQAHPTGKLGDPDNCSFHQFLEAKGTRPACWFVHAKSQYELNSQ